MTGLDLETFLHLLRADLGAWATLGLIASILGLLAWTSWGSRRALRKCLVLSILVHCGLALYGSTTPALLLGGRADSSNDAENHIRTIRVAAWSDPTGQATEPTQTRGAGSSDGRGGSRLAAWDRLHAGLARADTKLSATREPLRAPEPPRRSEPQRIETDAAAPTNNTPDAPLPESRPIEVAERTQTPAPASAPTPTASDEIAAATVTTATAEASTPARPGGRLRSDRRPPATVAPNTTAPRPSLAAPTLPTAQPNVDVARELGPLPAPASPGGAPADPAPEARPNASGEADVAAAQVAPARPETSRLAAGNPSLRVQGRPSPSAIASARPGPTRSAPADALTAPMATPDPGPVSVSTPPPVERSARAEAPPSTLPTTSAPALVGNEVAEPEVPPSRAPSVPLARTPEGDVRRRARPQPAPAPSSLATRPRTSTGEGSLALARVTPAGVPAPADIQGATGGRPLADVPEVYRSRLDPNRSALAYRAGASPASEQAVERALDWLARHQDADGRWDAATAKYDDGTAVKGDDDYTVHCPPAEPCFGECIYWEADSALTGLALLSFLGAGYTQTDGKYTETVGKGLDYLRSVQKPDGDLRGPSRAVGMYCHAMATIALCEAYALTGEEKLREPVARAIAFLAQARAKDGLAWRYAPGAPIGDTSILGWVVMALKSAREVGIEVPSPLQAGVLSWLAKVGGGEARGLARYQPGEAITPTMTAEAWVCRQFLGVGGPGPASGEAADFLLAHGPRVDPYNLYYWYYGTLAMFQHGGPAWARWNGEVRDAIVRRQRLQGHATGSWDPDESPYGAKGGRIYCTALATLSLEVYYRYLRLYDAPVIPPALAPATDQPRTLGRRLPTPSTTPTAPATRR